MADCSPEDFVTMLHSVLQQEDCAPHLQMDRGSVSIHKVGGKWNLKKWIEHLPGIGATTLRDFKSCMFAAGFTMQNVDIYEEEGAGRKRKRPTTISIVFSHPLFPEHLESIRDMHRMRRTINERDATIAEAHATMTAMDQHMLKQQQQITQLQQTLEKDDQERLGEIFNVQYSGSPTSVAVDDVSWDKLLECDV